VWEWNLEHRSCFFSNQVDHFQVSWSPFNLSAQPDLQPLPPSCTLLALFTLQAPLIHCPSCVVSPRCLGPSPLLSSRGTHSTAAFRKRSSPFLHSSWRFCASSTIVSFRPIIFLFFCNTILFIIVLYIYIYSIPIFLIYFPVLPYYIQSFYCFSLLFGSFSNLFFISSILSCSRA
jgi:hypothetical protein